MATPAKLVIKIVWFQVTDLVLCLCFFLCREEMKCNPAKTMANYILNTEYYCFLYKGSNCNLNGRKRQRQRNSISERIANKLMFSFIELRINWKPNYFSLPHLIPCFIFKENRNMTFCKNRKILNNILKPCSHIHNSSHDHQSKKLFGKKFCQQTFSNSGTTVILMTLKISINRSLHAPHRVLYMGVINLQSYR